MKYIVNTKVQKKETNIYYENISNINNEYTVLIKKRDEKLIKEKPKLYDLTNTYVENQFVECEVIEKNLEKTLWIIKKEKLKIKLVSLPQQQHFFCNAKIIIS